MSFNELKVFLTSWPLQSQLIAFGHTSLFDAMLLLIGLILFIPRVFLFSISLLFGKMLLLTSSSEVLHGHNLHFPSTQYCKLNLEA